MDDAELEELGRELDLLPTLRRLEADDEGSEGEEGVDDDNAVGIKEDALDEEDNIGDEADWVVEEVE